MALAAYKGERAEGIRLIRDSPMRDGIVRALKAVREIAGENIAIVEAYPAG